MKYSEARNYISDGDFIATLASHGLFGDATKKFTGEYTHCGIAVWLDGSLWMVEINGGKNHAIPMSQLSSEPIDVFYPPEGLLQEDIRSAALESIREKKAYGYVATIAIGILEYFNINKKLKWRNILVCSGYCVKIYNMAGWSFDDYIISPTRLASKLRKKFEIRV